MGLSIIASAKPEAKAAAWEFIKHMQKPEEIAALDQASGYLTFTKSSTSAMGSFLQENPNYKVAVDQMEWSRPQSEIQTVPRAVDIYYDAMLQCLALKADPKVLMPQVQKQVEAIVIEEGLKGS